MAVQIKIWTWINLKWWLLFHTELVLLEPNFAELVDENVSFFKGKAARDVLVCFCMVSFLQYLLIYFLFVLICSDCDLSWLGWLWFAVIVICADLCWLWFAVIVICTDCDLCWLWFMLIVLSGDCDLCWLWLVVIVICSDWYLCRLWFVPIHCEE